jgi:hypothetical protein
MCVTKKEDSPGTDVGDRIFVRLFLKRAPQPLMMRLLFSLGAASKRVGEPFEFRHETKGANNADNSGVV